MMKLVILDGEMAGREYLLEYDFISIGREEGTDIHVPVDPSISRRHAVIRKEYGRYVLEDLGSTNGSYIIKPNGEEEEIIHGVLTDGKVFRIGSTRMQIVQADQEVVIDTKLGDNMEVISDSTRDFNVRKSLDPGDVYATSFLSVPEDRKAVEELNYKIKLFYELGVAIGKIMDLDQLLSKIMDYIFEMFPVQRGFLMLLNEDSHELETKVVRRKLPPNYKQKDEKIEISRTIINQVLREKRAILSDDARIDERFGMPDSVFLHDIKASVYVPLLLERRIIGILCVDNYTSSHVFTENDMRLMTIIATQAASAIENARLHQNMKKLFVSSIRALANAIEARDAYTRGHSERVTDYAVHIAERMKLDSEEIEKIRYAALLHDIGKINIREEILNKPGRLTDEEYYIMSQHPVYGAKIMEPVEEFRAMLPYMYHHHERYGSGGYPDGLKGDDIPLASRILTVADSFDAMTSDRPYRNALPLEKSIKELEQNVGTQFDPRVVSVFIDIVNNERDWLDSIMKKGQWKDIASKGTFAPDNIKKGFKNNISPALPVPIPKATASLGGDEDEEIKEKEEKKQEPAKEEKHPLKKEKPKEKVRERAEGTKTGELDGKKIPESLRVKSDKTGKRDHNPQQDTDELEEKKTAETRIINLEDTIGDDGLPDDLDVLDLDDFLKDDDQ